MKRGLLGITVFIAGGQETMTNEQSTNHFYMLDLLHKEKGWQKMPGWEGPSLAYAVSVVQGGRFYLFSGRSYAPNEVMVEYTEGYVYEPGSRKWSKIAGNFPVMAGTAIPYEKDKRLLQTLVKNFKKNGRVLANLFSS